MTEPADTVIDEQGRPEPPMAADEVDTLLGFLEFQRATFEWRTRGLGDDQLRAGLPPTSMTLGGMLMHLSFVEDFWFELTVGRRPPTEPFASADWDADPDFDWNTAAAMTGDELRAFWAAAVERSRATVAAAMESADGLSQTFPAWGGAEHPSLRWILTHMIEEYARHNGHADLLRESIDGETGE